MMKEGAMDGVGTVFGIHLWSDLETGRVSVEAGPRMASTGILKITVKGKSGHGSMPHQGVDAILAASAVVVDLQSIASREISPLDPVVITIGKYNGGARWNVLCGEVVMEGTRCFPETAEKLPILSAGWQNTAASYRAEAK